MNDITIRTLGRYRPIEQIGRGGMASVYKAYDPTKDRYVALKVLHPDLAQDKQFGRRFRREAKVVMGLRHPNIVPVEDFGEQDGYAFLVMPLIGFGSLSDRLQDGPLSLDEGSRFMANVTAGLHFAHGQGVVHRDVKPSNILLSGSGSALLSDFGLAHVQDASIGLTGSALIGTPAYVSPEQARGEPVTACSDQYSLGVILYQLSTGALPFDAETPIAMVLKQISEPLPMARTRSPNVPDSVERVILKSTAKDPEHRFASVAEMNEVFQAGIAHDRHPLIHPAPTIQLPPVASSVDKDHTIPAKPFEPKRKRRLAGYAALSLLLFLFAGTASASFLRNTMDSGVSPAEGGQLLLSEMNDVQLTELAGTIEAMSTELAAAQDGMFPPEIISTMVMQTLEAEPDGERWGNTPAASPAAASTLAPLSVFLPTSAPTHTSTPIPTATASPRPISTATNVPLPIPSTTSMPAASATLPPPPSPASEGCASIELGELKAGGKNKDRLEIKVVNNGSNVIRIDGLHLEWDSESDRLKDIDLDKVRIWDAHDDDPPTDIPAEGEWKDGADRTIAATDDEKLVFRFDESVEAGEPSVIITFDNFCEISS